MDDVVKWPWRQSLAMARKGDFLEVKEVLFGTLRDHLHNAGVRSGTRLEYLGRNDEGVEVLLADGRGVRVAPDHTWFVVVEVDGHGDRQGSPGRPSG